MIIKRNRTKKQVLISWLISYLLILILPIMSWFYMLWQYDIVVHRQIDEMNSRMLESMCELYESEINPILINSYHLVIDPQIRNMTATEEALDISAAVDSLKIRDLLADFVVKHTFCESAYVYFSKSDCVISNQTKAGSTIFYSTEYTEPYNKAYSINYSQWVDSLCGLNQRTFTYWPADKGSDSIVYLLPFNMAKDSGTGAVICLTLKSSKITSLIDKLTASNGAIVAIYSDYGELLATNSPTAPDELDMGSYSMRSVSSTSLGWQLHSYFPLSIYSEPTRNLLKYSGLSLAGAVAACALIIIYALRKNYNPLRDMVASLERHNFASKGMSELDYIKRSIDAVLETNEQSNVLLSQHREKLRVAYIERLMLGHADMGISMEEYLPLLDFDYSSNAFAVLLLDCAGDEDCESQLCQLVNIDDCSRSLFYGYHVRIDGRLAALVDVSGMPQDEYERNIVTMAGSLYDFSQSIVLAASDIHETALGIAVAYDEALYTLDYLCALGSESFLFYSKIAEESSGSYQYSPEDERRFINCVSVGDKAAARKIMKEIWDKNTSQMISMDLAWLLMMDFLSSVLKARPEQSLNIADGKMLDVKISRLRYLSADDMFKVLDKAIDIVCKPDEGHESCDNSLLRQQIIEYINENYADPNLSVDQICQHFGRSRSSVFALFSSKTQGESLLEIINRTRIEAAKRLLSQGTYGINDIGRMVGYVNINTFLRVFKKYESITPGQFKLMAEQSETL
ncbi:MAG: helix-turn-helix transcriptional regulator [Christensenellales bacterium]